MGDLADKTLRGVHWLGFMKTIQQAMSWALTMLVARLLSPSDYGLMGIAVIVISFSRILCEFGMATAIVQKKDLQKIEIDTVFWLTICTGILFYTALYFLSPGIAFFFDSMEVKSVLKILGVNFIIGGAVTIPLALLVRDLKFKEKSISEFIAAITSNSLILILAFKGFGVWSLVTGSICNNLILLVLVCYYQKFIPYFEFSIKKTFEILKFGSHIVGSRILWYFYSKSDFIIVGKFVNKENLGVYSIAFQIASMPIDKVAEIINPVAYATFSKLQDNAEELKKYFLLFVKGICVVLFPALSGLAMVAPEFVSSVLTMKWNGIILPLQCLCIVGIVRVTVQPIASLLNARGKAHLNLKYNLLSTLLMPMAFLIGVKINGITGVVMAWVLIYPFLASYILLLGLKELKMPVKEFTGSIYSILGSTVIMGGSILLVRTQLYAIELDYIKLFLLILTGILSYAGSLYFLSPQIKDEFKAFISLNKKK